MMKLSYCSLLQIGGSSGFLSKRLTLAGSSSNSSKNLSMNSITNSNSNDRANHASKDETFRFLFTSDFELIEWMEQLNGVEFAYKLRKIQNSVTASEIEGRINHFQKYEEPFNKPTEIRTCNMGTLELLIKYVDGLSQPSKVFVAVELKSFGSYFQVANTRVIDLTTQPVWDEKFSLELLCVNQMRVILYCQTSAKPLALGSQELTFDPEALNSTKTMSINLNNNCNLIVTMKFVSPTDTITHRHNKKNDLFGNNRNEFLQKEKFSIPRILTACVEVIETKGIEELGVYRVSAVVSEVQRIKDLFAKNPYQAQSEIRQKSPHLAANVLKSYLQELPEPLFASNLYPAFICSLELKEDERDETLRKLFNDMPEEKQTVLIFLLNHLINIANNSEKNLMNMQNLATLFGPILLKRAPNDKLNLEKEISGNLQPSAVLLRILQLHSNERLLQKQ